jgi:hypothetical protein
MTRLQFELKHGHLPAGCCYLGRCGRDARRDARDLTLTRREAAVLKPDDEISPIRPICPMPTENFWEMAGEPSPLPASWRHPSIEEYAQDVWVVFVRDNATNSSVLVGKFRERKPARTFRDSLLQKQPFSYCK